MEVEEYYGHYIFQNPLNLLLNQKKKKKSYRKKMLLVTLRLLRRNGSFIIKIYYEKKIVDVILNSLITQNFNFLEYQTRFLST